MNKKGVNVLFISYSDMDGGASMAAYRIHKSLFNTGAKSKMLVEEKIGDDPSVITSETGYQKLYSLTRSMADKKPVKKYNPGKQFTPLWVPFSGIVKKIKRLNPDIIHLNWIGGGMLRIEELAKLNKPIVWSLHDMWPFTGGCHYDNNCGKYLHECTSCPILGSTGNDLSTKIFRRKLKTYKKIESLTVVGSSAWLTECAGNSRLFAGREAVNLPTPVELDIFKPLEKVFARKTLGLPLDKSLVVFGAVNATADARKGFSELVEALKLIKADEVEAVVFGSRGETYRPDLDIKINYIGRYKDQLSMSLIYNAADVLVVPSLQENLSNIILEALSCGTPVAAFNIGGNPDMIEHKDNGYLADYRDAEDLAHGIQWIVNNSDHQRLSENARIKVKQNFSFNVVGKLYSELYAKILG